MYTALLLCRESSDLCSAVNVIGVHSAISSSVGPEAGRHDADDRVGDGRRAEDRGPPQMDSPPNWARQNESLRTTTNSFPISPSCSVKVRPSRGFTPATRKKDGVTVIDSTPRGRALLIDTAIVLPQQRLIGEHRHVAEAIEVVRHGRLQSARGRPHPGTRCPATSTRSGSGSASGLSSTPRTTEKNAVLAPMQTASVSESRRREGLVAPEQSERPRAGQ